MLKNRPSGSDVGQRESKAAVDVNVMEFQILRFQPGVAPLESFTFAEFAEQIFFAHPIDQTDKRTQVRGKAVENAAP